MMVATNEIKIVEYRDFGKHSRVYLAKEAYMEVKGICSTSTRFDKGHGACFNGDNDKTNNYQVALS